MLLVMNIARHLEFREHLVMVPVDSTSGCKQLRAD